MEISEYLSSGYFIILFFPLTGAVFILLYLIRYFIPIVFPGRVKINIFRKYFTVFEGLTWVFYLLASAVFFLKHNIVFSAVLFILILLLFFWYARFALRDYVAGIVFKSENRFLLHDIIEADGIKGEIRKFHYRNIELETDNGKLVLVPYSLLLGIVGSPQSVGDSVLNYSFEISISGKKSFDIVAENLKKFILTLPWATIKNEPRIQLIIENNDYITLKITLYSFDEKYFQPMRKKIETYLKQNS